MSRSSGAREDQFLGAILGFAIGDALGRPFVGMTADEIRQANIDCDAYIPPADDPETEVPGEITGISEVMLCLIESITTNGGNVDPENINARLVFLLNGPARPWISDAVAEGIRIAADHDGVVADEYQPPTELAAALRGVPVGLLHAVRGGDPEAMSNDASLVAKLSHGSGAQIKDVVMVARLIAEAARTRHLPSFPDDADVTDPVIEEIRGVAREIHDAEVFEVGVCQAIRLGGRTNETAALAGALLGAAGGASVLPQHLIDGLDARIYLSLAAPWFFRSAQHRASTAVGLHIVDSGA